MYEISAAGPSGAVVAAGLVARDVAVGAAGGCPDALPVVVPVVSLDSGSGIAAGRGDGLPIP